MMSTYTAGATQPVQYPVPLAHCVHVAEVMYVSQQKPPIHQLLTHWLFRVQTAPAGLSTAMRVAVHPVWPLKTLFEKLLTSRTLLADDHLPQHPTQKAIQLVAGKVPMKHPQPFAAVLIRNTEVTRNFLLMPCAHQRTLREGSCWCRHGYPTPGPPWR